VAEKQILPSPKVKSDKVLPPAASKIVKQLSDEIKIMLGTKNYISVNSKDKLVIFRNNRHRITQNMPT
jgi:hypothetical protein